MNLQSNNTIFLNVQIDQIVLFEFRSNFDTKFEKKNVNFYIYFLLFLP